MRPGADLSVPVLGVDEDLGELEADFFFDFSGRPAARCGRGPLTQR